MYSLRIRLKTLLCLYGILLIIYTLCRIAFYCYNKSDFDALHTGTIIQVFLYGIRFDLAAILITNSVFTLLYLLPLKSIGLSFIFNRLLKIFFIIFNVPFIALNLIDVAYFPFVQKRIQNDTLHFLTGAKGTEALSLIPLFLIENWELALLFLMMVWLLYKFYNALINYSFDRSSPYNFNAINWIPVFFIVGLNVIGIRGGLQLRPINILDASNVAGVTNAPLVLNSTFSLVRTWQKNKLEEKFYFKEPSENVCDQPVKIIEPDSTFTIPPSNVVIIIVESLSKKYLTNQKSVTYTPFLDSLLEESLAFSGGFANARESVQGIPAILASLPSWMDESFIFSRYATNSVNSLASVLKRSGYNTSFFHGAATGTMGFYSFTKAVGFDAYFGMEDYNNAQHFDGSWGIWDHHFLPYMADELAEMEQPFLSAVLTLNTHHPFLLPKGYKVANPNKNHPVLNSVQYVDDVLSNFFDKIKNKPWFKNTLFIITADHTGPNIDTYRTSVDDYSIPIVFYKTDGSLRGKSDEIISHIDIMPSVLHLLGIKDRIFSFGKNIFDPICDSRIVNYKMGIYQYTDAKYHLYFDGQTSLALYDYVNDTKLSHNLINDERFTDKIYEIEIYLKRIIQGYNHAMIYNKMTPDAYIQ